MSENNYTPDEVRLLDEFAKVALADFLIEWNPSEAYDKAEQMLAERRKRVHVPRSTIKSFREAMEQKHTPPAEQPEVLLSECDRKALDDLRAELPPAEQPADGGLLTEDAIDQWDSAACSRWIDGTDYRCERVFLARAVAMLREGLAAKAEVARLKQVIAQGAADLRAADAAITNTRRERDEARAALAEAQPVLDAVVQCHSGATPFMHSIAAGKLLDNYADRRREQEKNAGGAS